MDLKNLITNKAFLFERQEEKSDGDEVVLKILEKEKYKEINNIQYLGTNFNFDSYRAEADGRAILIKYSLDPDSKFLFNEFDFLRSNTSIWKPVSINFNTIKIGDPVTYSIQTFEYAENVEEIGRGIIWENLESFLICYCSIQNANHLPSRNFKSYLQSKLEECSVESIPEEAVSLLKERNEYDRLCQLVNLIIDNINQLYKQDVVNANEFVHGNIKLSNILFRNDAFKLINFTDCYKGNAFFDLAALVCCMDLDFDQEKSLFYSFIKFQKKEFSIELWQSYKICYDIFIRLLLLQIVFSYLKEVYVLESSRPSKINKLINTFILNADRFYKINGIIPYVEFLYTSLLEPLIGRKEESNSGVGN